MYKYSYIIISLMDTAAASLWNTLPIDIKNALHLVCLKKT